MRDGYKVSINVRWKGGGKTRSTVLLSEDYENDIEVCEAVASEAMQLIAYGKRQAHIAADSSVTGA